MNNFIREFYQKKVINLVAIDPSGKNKIKAHAFRDPDTADEWAKTENEAGNNIYFLVNGAGELTKKASKGDIEYLYAVFADIDPDKSKDRESERTRIQNIIRELSLTPSAIIDSGNGYALYWYFEFPMEVNDMTVDLVENINQRIAEALGGDAVQNIDRIMRYPDTINYPTKTKLAAGYQQCKSKTVRIDGVRYAADQILKWLDSLQPEVKQRNKREGKGRPPRKKLDILLARDEKVKSLWNGHPTETQQDTSRSGFDMTLLSMLKQRGLDEKEVFHALELFEYGKLNEQKKPQQYFDRMWGDSIAPQPLLFRIDAGDIVKRYAFIKDQDKFYDGKSGIFLSRSALNDAHLKDYPGGKQGPKASEAFFLDDECIVTDTVTWVPEDTRIINERGAVKLNTYVVPNVALKEGDVSRWLDHVKFIVGDDDHMEHLLDWMAYNLQHPNIKINHQILIAGTPRIGKDLMFNPMVSYFGYRNVSHPQAEQMHQGFNEYLNGKKLIMVEEIMNFEKRSYENQLKPLCAAPPDYLHINAKGLRQYEIPNVVSLVFFSNEHDAISIRTKGDSRYFCLWCQRTRKDDAYYTELVNWYRDEGNAMVAQWLLSRDLKHFNPGGGAPETEYRKEIGAMSVSEHELELQEDIHAYREPFDQDLVTAKDIIEHYKEAGIKSAKRAGMILRRLEAVKFECVYKEDGKAKKQYLWAVRDVEKYRSIYNVEGAKGLLNVYENSF